MTLRSAEAHQSGDGVTIAHCPFCGSGQVIGRSDGNVECQFCNQAFMVRVQPMYSAFPQSVDGMPVQIPGMPAPDPAMGMDPAAGGDMPPGADGDDEDGGAPPFGDDDSSDSSEDSSEDFDEGEGSSDDSDDDDSGDGGPPFGKKSYRTSTGRTLPHAAYVAYLAAHLQDRR